MASRSATYYRKNKKARAKKAAYDKKFNARPSEKKKRAANGRTNYAHDKRYGEGSRAGKDLSHTANGTVYKPSSVNRGSKSDTPGDRRARGGNKSGSK